MRYLIFAFFSLSVCFGFAKAPDAQRITLRCVTTDCVKGSCALNAIDTLAFDPRKNETYDDLCRVWKDATGGETRIFEYSTYIEILCDRGNREIRKGVRDAMSIKIDRYSGEAVVRVWEGTIRKRGEIWYMKRMQCASSEKKF